MDALAFFTARLQFQTDVSDVYAAQGEFVLIDSRGHAGWHQGHIPGALHLPTDDIAERAPTSIDLATPVVTYCWGPGCNGATRAAREFAKLGYQVKEMLGGVEYWIREGFPIQTDDGTTRQPADPLTAPLHAITCDC
ncbi:rhodanese-like domain-containing protein [Kibdelosporangium philippinense]|uniref:Rhodanese-like domain-containing protein n=1 Tax=Kibdelosporangium philippinense TaxID=211113 RepID=A0ABS8Z839_9PSEU|nr:rhodanese-like domain-containing protein [Kibdelosporangium philippinense]MCE7004056.1 rhodanese-like domain-containing protein [Kibdelosporangium philippinense]